MPERPHTSLSNQVQDVHNHYKHVTSWHSLRM